MRNSAYALFIFILLPLISSGQTRTIQATGNWDAAGTWQSGSIADVVSEDVAFTGGADKTATVRSGFTYTVGNIALDNVGNLNIVGTLNVGDASNSRDVTANNGPSITVSGTLIIWGDVVVNNNLAWTISGTVIIKGSVTLNNGASMTVSGDLTIDGDFTAGNNTQVVNSGNIAVGGAVTVGGGTTSLTNSGTFTAGSCSGNASFCSGVLPVVLISFDGRFAADHNDLFWATAMEVDFDRFVIQRAGADLQFYDIGEVKGAGVNNFIVLKYTFQDNNPIAGKNYYRLQMLDLDGKFEYSNVIVVNSNGAKNVMLYPNPAEGTNLSILTNFQPGASDRLEIFDNLGTKIQEVVLNTIQNKIDVATDLKQGAYILRYVSEQHVQTIRFSVK
ncbi:MAG: T9SS type A sorting domain-containing protein [Bacteroidota bacterium]